MSATEAVLFDLDDTLCCPERSDHEFNRAVFERAGIDPLFSAAELRAVDPDEIDDSTGITGFYTNLYRATVRKHGIDVEGVRLDELGAIAGELYDEMGVRFREGARETLAWVREHHDVGLVTNGRRGTQRGKLRELGIADAFDAEVYCHPDHGVPAKPATDPFERVLSELSATPETAVMVGDSHPEDVLGAHRAGIRTVWSPVDRPHADLPGSPDPAPTHRIDALPELRGIL